MSWPSMTFSLTWKQVMLSWKKKIFIMLKFQKNHKNTLEEHGVVIFLIDFICSPQARSPKIVHVHPLAGAYANSQHLGR